MQIKEKKNQCELARKLVLFSFIYTANAATTRNERRGSESVGMTHLREWKIKAKSNQCELAHKLVLFFFYLYGECRDNEERAKRFRVCRHDSFKRVAIPRKIRNLRCKFLIYAAFSGTRNIRNQQS